jgi:hypothetical protein
VFKVVMSKILVIEPYKILRHAFAVALSNARQVEIVAAFPEAGLVSGADVVIVDGAALRQQNSLTEKNIRTIEKRKLPTIWIDFDGETPMPGNDALQRFEWPMEKETLRKTVTECLGRIDGLPRGDSKTAKAEEAPTSTNVKSIDATSPHLRAVGEKKVIELVDVVE